MKSKSLSQSLDSSSVNKSMRQTPKYMSFTKAFSLTYINRERRVSSNYSFNDRLIGFDPSVHR